MNHKFLKITLFCICIFSLSLSFAQNGILWKKNFGGVQNDYFTAVTEVSDGFVAVGYSDFASFGTGNWEDVTGKGNLDAIIVKYDNEGNILWRKNFGGESADAFEAVAITSNGIVAVGYADFSSFGTGDLTELERKGLQDAIIVLFDLEGNIIWKHNLGGNENSYSKFTSVSSNDDGIFTVGYADGFGEGDWEEVTGKGKEDAMVIKFDLDGNIIWKKNFGGADTDRFLSVSSENDCIIAVGVSAPSSFENGNWELDTCKGGNDAIAVKFDFDGNLLWQKNFGGLGTDIFHAVTGLEDGFVVAGISFPTSFGNGDWETVSVGNGWEDAMIVKFDYDGNIVWKKNFGGDGWDCFYAVSKIYDELIAVGGANAFGSGDWDKFWGKGYDDAIMVGFDFQGNVKWKTNFGGKDTDCFNSVSSINDAIVVVGFSNFDSFNNGNWANVEGNGWEDAIIVQYGLGEVGIKEYKELEGISVYPNPTRGELRVTSYELQVTSIEVFDVYGRNVGANLRVCPDLRVCPESRIDISDLTSGVYFVKIYTESGVVTKKVIKQ